MEEDSKMAGTVCEGRGILTTWHVEDTESSLVLLVLRGLGAAAQARLEYRHGTVRSTLIHDRMSVEFALKATGAPEKKRPF